MRSVADTGMLSIFFATYDIDSAVCHYRLALPAGALRRAGHVCHVGTGLLAGPQGVVGVTPDGSLVRGIDIIVLQPMLGADLADVLHAAHRAGQRVVVDLDDWFWDTPEFPVVNGAMIPTDFKEWCDRTKRIIGESHLVTVSTPYIAEQVRSWGSAPPQRVLRNAIDLERWHGPEVVTDGPVLGYAGSLYNHFEDVRILRGWFGTFLERHDLRMIHVGGHPSLPTFAELVGVAPERIDVRAGQPWSTYASSHPFADMDIGIVPLLARPFNAAKSALKGMEYAASGIPFVTSASPEYRWMNTGVTVGDSFDDQSPERWIEALEEMLDPLTRRNCATHQAHRVANEDISLRWREWEAAYLELASR